MKTYMHWLFASNAKVPKYWLKQKKIVNGIRRENERHFRSSVLSVKSYGFRDNS
jgi:hypothetical protein